MPHNNSHPIQYRACVVDLLGVGIRACVVDLLGVGIIMCGIYCVYKQSRSCQLPFCASPIFHFEIGDFSIYLSPHFLWSAM